MQQGWRMRLASACAAAALTLATAHAADVTETAHRDAMATTPALVKAAGIVCTVSDARHVPGVDAAAHRKRTDLMSAAGGGGGDRTTGIGGNGASAAIDVNQDVYSGGAHPLTGLPLEEYEVACSEGLGYLINVMDKQTSVASLCIAMPDGDAASKTPTTQCQLGGNSAEVSLRTVKAYAAKAGVTCDAQRARAVGNNATSTAIEVVCGNSDGYVLLASNPPQPGQPVRSVDCLSLNADSVLHCQFTDGAAQLLAMDALMHQAQPACQVVARRYVGSTATGSKFVEFECRDNKGYLLKRSATGFVEGTVACTDPVVANFGGCKLGSSAPK